MFAIRFIILPPVNNNIFMRFMNFSSINCYNIILFTSVKTIFSQILLFK